MRAMMSLEPPGAKPITMRTGLTGAHSVAIPMVLMEVSAAISAARATNRVVEFFIFRDLLRCNQ